MWYKLGIRENYRDGTVYELVIANCMKHEMGQEKGRDGKKGKALQNKITLIIFNKLMFPYLLLGFKHSLNDHYF